jgi:ceramide glucosyltransferase
MTYLLIGIAVVLFAEKVWKHLMVVRFFRRPRPTARREPQLVSILQPILSGDPTLRTCLEQNLRNPCRYAREFLWLVDDTDAEGQAICRDLIARHPEPVVRLLLLPPPADRCSPKMLKLLAAIPQARGDVICILDDDTVLPEHGLEECLPYLAGEGVGLAFGLPYYVSFGNLWSRLVAYFVNSHSLLTYLPYTYLVEPFTINGMFYAFRRDVYEATGGFAGLETILADDFAVARHFRSKGYRLAQSPVRHGISTHVQSLGAYFRLLHRWFVFPRETLMKAMPWRNLALAYGLGLVSALAPLGLAVAALVSLDGWVTALAILYVAYHYAIFAHFNLAYLRRASPWGWSWLVVFIQLFLPLQLLAAIVLPQRVRWRGHVMQIEPGGGFRFVERRTG